MKKTLVFRMNVRFVGFLFLPSSRSSNVAGLPHLPRMLHERLSASRTASRTHRAANVYSVSYNYASAKGDEITSTKVDRLNVDREVGGFYNAGSGNGRSLEEGHSDSSLFVLPTKNRSFARSTLRAPRSSRRPTRTRRTSSSRSTATQSTRPSPCTTASTSLP